MAANCTQTNPLSYERCEVREAYVIVPCDKKTSHIQVCAHFLPLFSQLSVPALVPSSCWETANLKLERWESADLKLER